MLAQLDTLILDEAGMMSGELLQALDMYITRARKKAIRRMRAELGKVGTHLHAVSKAHVLNVFTSEPVLLEMHVCPTLAAC